MLTVSRSGRRKGTGRRAAPGQDRRGRPPVPVWPARPLSGTYRRYPERPTGQSCGHHPVCRGRASRAPPRARLLLADLRWADVHLARRDLVVRRGKGGMQRVVALSATLRQALAALARRAEGYVLPYRTAGSAWRHMQALCQAAEVTPKGVHPLRHAAGTRLYAETRELEATARHLGHSKLETTRIYAKWSDRQLRETIGRWYICRPLALSAAVTVNARRALVV